MHVLDFRALVQAEVLKELHQNDMIHTVYRHIAKVNKELRGHQLRYQLTGGEGESSTLPVSTTKTLQITDMIAGPGTEQPTRLPKACCGE